ncbi:MAG TPA: hypothetical protein VIY48_15590 [Candidatus Paceibacterota bacterium]
MSSVFVIMNEWTSNGGNTGAEVVGANFFESENEAHEALGYIAESYDIHLPACETSLQLEDHLPHLQFEEYYIQELTKGASE